ncbi:hypothetical protein Dimus_010502 [Dionaea muscipula]
MEDLPDEYILHRWTKSAKAIRVKDRLGACTTEVSLLERRSKLFNLASRVIDEVVCTEDRTSYVEEVLSKTETSLLHMRAASDDGDRSVKTPSSVRDHTSQEVSLKEPLQVRAKGCGKRLKGGKEKGIKKPRRCTGCGLSGQSHDKRNCPKLLNASAQNTRLNEGVYQDEDEIDTDGEDTDDLLACRFGTLLLGFGLCCRLNLQGFWSPFDYDLAPFASWMTGTEFRFNIVAAWHVVAGNSGSTLLLVQHCWTATFVGHSEMNHVRWTACCCMECCGYEEFIFIIGSVNYIHLGLFVQLHKSYSKSCHPVCSYNMIVQLQVSLCSYVDCAAVIQ